MKSRILTIFAAAALLATPQLASSQSDPFAPGPATPPPPDKKFDIEFNEIQVQEACNFIVEILSSAEQPLNIVVSKEAKEIVLPDMMLKQITFTQFVSFINQIGSENPGSGVEFGMSESDGIWYFWADLSTPEDPFGGGLGGPADPFAPPPAVNPSPEVQEEVSTTVYPLDAGADDTLGLIEEAIKQTRQTDKSPNPAIKFHEPSQTLIVTGKNSDLLLIERILEAIESRNLRKEQMSSAHMMRDRSQQVSALRDQNDALKAELDAARAEAAATTAAFETRLNATEAEKQLLKAELEKLKSNVSSETTDSAPIIPRNR